MHSVAFPFGFGLSTTTFAICQAWLVKAVLTDAQPEPVQLDEPKLGDMDGAVQLQATVMQQQPRPYWPEMPLCAFCMLFIMPGATVAVQLEYSALPFMQWQECTQTWVLPAAACSVAIGTAAAAIVATLPVHLNGTNVTNFKNIPAW